MYRTLEEMAEDESLCEYCDAEPGWHSTSSGDPICCENNWCKEAYDRYLVENELTENVVKYAESVHLKNREVFLTNKMNFEFDFDEVFDGIKQGVIKELSEMNFEEATNIVISDVKNELYKKIRLTYSDESELKNEIKSEVRDKIFDTLIKEVGDKYIEQFEKYVEEQLTKNPKRLNSMMSEIKSEVGEKLYNDLYSSIKRDTSTKVQEVVSKMLDFIGGTESEVKGTKETISKEELNELRHRDDVLSALEAGGVDSWEWYGESINQYFGEE